MKIEAFKAVCEWLELRKVTQYLNGEIRATQQTNPILHIRKNIAIPSGFVAVAISAKPNAIVTINPFN